jgi:hypothetical protein
MSTPTIDVYYEDDVLDYIVIGDKEFDNTPGSSADTIIDAIQYALSLEVSS